MNKNKYLPHINFMSYDYKNIPASFGTYERKKKQKKKWVSGEEAMQKLRITGKNGFTKITGRRKSKKKHHKR